MNKELENNLEELDHEALGIEEPNVVDIDVEKKVEDMKDNNVSFREWNDTVSDWLDEYEGKLNEALEKGELSEEEYQGASERMLSLRHRYITDEYVDNLIDHLDSLDLEYVNGKMTLEKKSSSFERFVQNTCRKNFVDINTIVNTINMTLDKCCNNEKEKKTFKAILYDVSRHESVNKSKDGIKAHTLGFRFINLFLVSMREYGVRLFNRIVERYLEVKEEG